MSQSSIDFSPFSQAQAVQDGMMVIYGLPPSKSNSYRIITIKQKDAEGKVKHHGSLKKSDDLKKYESNFLLQINPHVSRLKVTGEFKVFLNVYYPNRRSDLDGAFKCFLDCLQTSGVIENDNLCMGIMALKRFDKSNPRIEFKLEKV